MPPTTRTAAYDILSAPPTSRTAAAYDILSRARAFDAKLNEVLKSEGLSERSTALDPNRQYRPEVIDKVTFTTKL